MYRKLFQFALVLGLFFATAPAHAGLFNTEEALNASAGYAADPMFQSVGCVYSNVAGSWLRGSGVLIAPDWVLTSGHNIVGTDDLGGGISELRFYTGLDISNYDNRVLADAWYVYPGYTAADTGGHGSDIGLIHLSQPIVDVSPAVLFSGEDQRGTLMSMAGFGQYGTRSTGPQGSDYIMRAGSNLATNFGGDGPYAFAESQYWIAQFDPLGFPNVQPLEWQSAPGDSGAGWFANIDGQSMLVGINSFEAGSYTASGATRVSLYDEWIQTTTAVPEPSSLAILSTLALFFPALRRWGRR